MAKETDSTVLLEPFFIIRIRGYSFLRYNITSQEDQKTALLATQEHVESQVVGEDNLAELPSRNKAEFTKCGQFGV